MSEKQPKETSTVEPILHLPVEHHTLDGEIINGKYRLKKAIAKGGMGVIYVADQLVLEREVAIKLVLQQTDPIAEKRFLQEASLAAKIDHPNVVKIYDFGKDERQRMYLVMELLQGMPLNEYVRQLGPLNNEQTIELGLQLSEALVAVHNNGIVHRDIKPANIFMLKTPGNRICSRLIDFGLVKSLHEEEQVKTQTGFVLGSPMYMAPEQITSEPIDGRTDIYSLGLTLYYALTGNSPFSNDNIAAMLHNQLMNPPQPMTVACPDRSFPINLQWVIETSICKKPESRLQNANQSLSIFEYLHSTKELFQPLYFSLKEGQLYGLDGKIVSGQITDPPTLKHPTSQITHSDTKETILMSDIEAITEQEKKHFSWPLIAIIAALLLTLAGMYLSSTTSSEVVVNQSFVLKSEPSKAEVYQNGILMGTTPMNYSLSTTDKLIVTLQKPGFEEQKIVLNANNPNPNITLKPVASSVTPPPTPTLPQPTAPQVTPQQTEPEVSPKSKKNRTPRRSKTKKSPSGSQSAPANPPKTSGDLKDPWAD